MIQAYLLWTKKGEKLRGKWKRKTYKLNFHDKGEHVSGLHFRVKVKHKQLTVPNYFRFQSLLFNLKNPRALWLWQKKKT